MSNTEKCKRMSEGEIIESLDTEIRACELRNTDCNHLREAIRVLEAHKVLKSALRSYGDNRDMVTKYRPDWQYSERVNAMMESAKILQIYMQGKEP